MIDLHTHTFFSDGDLIPSELVYRAKCNGYSAIAITDHADYSNMEFIIPNMLKVAKVLSENYDIIVLAGVELTYVPPKLIPDAADKARELGAKVIVVHGQTTAENVPPETNLYAVKSKIDILAHPGHLSKQEAQLAEKNDIKIEITTRKGHNATNDEVAKVALEAGAKLVLNTDTHTLDNLLTKTLMEKTLKDAGLKLDFYNQMLKNSREIVAKYI